MDHVLFDYRWLCPSGRAKIVSNKFVCDCGMGFKYDTDKKQCILNRICSDGSIGRKECSSMNAICLIDQGSLSGIYRCACPPGTQLTTMNNITKCVAYCQIGDRNAKCLDINARCDPIIAPKEYERVTDYCRCAPGYLYKDNVCVVQRNARKFRLNFKYPKSFSNTVIPALIDESRLDLENFHNNVLHNVLEDYLNEIEQTRKANKILLDNLQNTKDMQNYFIDQVATYIGKVIIELVKLHDIELLQMMSCDEHGDFFDCEFAIESRSQDSLDQLGAKLIESCVKIPDQDDLCFIKVSNAQTYKQESNSYDSDENHAFVVINTKHLMDKGQMQFINVSFFVTLPKLIPTSSIVKGQTISVILDSIQIVSKLIIHQVIIVCAIQMNS